MIYVTIAVVILSFSPQKGSFSENINNVTLWDWSGTTKTFGIAVFAYACHPNVPDIYIVRIALCRNCSGHQEGE